MVNISIDGHQIQAEPGKTILEVAEEIGIKIPILCHHPALPAEGACRLCLVEVGDQRSLQPACTFRVSEGLEITTRNSRIDEARRFILELLLSNHPLDCLTCDAAGRCLLQEYAYEYGAKPLIQEGLRSEYSIDSTNPFIQVDRNKCILCRRCVRACSNINGIGVISLHNRSSDSHIAFGEDTTMALSQCEFCGSCVAVCPTGALFPKQSLGKGRSWQIRQVQTVCPYCGVGCQIVLGVRDNEIVRVDSAWDAPVNHGWTCVKGRFGIDFVHHPDRLTKPRVRKYLLDGTPRERGRGEWVEVDWRTALHIAARKITEVRGTFGPDSIGVLTSAKCTNEENYLMNKFARQVIGTNNIDHCARL